MSLSLTRSISVVGVLGLGVAAVIGVVALTTPAPTTDDETVAQHGADVETVNPAVRGLINGTG